MKFIFGSDTLVAIPQAFLRPSSSEDAQVPLLDPGHDFPRHALVSRELSETTGFVAVNPQFILGHFMSAHWRQWVPAPGNEMAGNMLNGQTHNRLSLSAVAADSWSSIRCIGTSRRLPNFCPEGKFFCNK